MADGATGARRARSSADGAGETVTAGSADRIVFLGHATVLIEVNGVRLLTDPLLRDRVAHLRRRVAPVRPDIYANLDAVLISHLHHDHLDLASLRLLGLDTALLVPAGAGVWLRERGFTDVTELSAGEEVSVGNVATGGDARTVGEAAGSRALTVRAVEARHDGRRRVGPHGLHAATLGYVAAGRRTVYFAGDTELFDGMSSLFPQLDVALLPVAGWGPTLGAGHMGPLDAARATSLLCPRIAIPIHWGTLSPIGSARHRERLGDPPRVFAEHVAGLAPSVEVRVLEPGRETML
jgi:L-ascorbate metabolism protein UlaG (beta-lactamase superfamily)